MLEDLSRSDEVGWRRLELEYIERSHKTVHLTSGGLSRAILADHYHARGDAFAARSVRAESPPYIRRIRWRSAVAVG